MTDLYTETIFFTAQPEPPEYQARLKRVESRLLGYLPKGDENERS